MIPIKLEVENFLSFKKASFDFNSIDFALVVGVNHQDENRSNGAGKSAFFSDAITWVLYEQSRVKSLDKIIRKGATYVSVAFVFIVDNQEYKVVRTRDLHKNPSLNFFVKSSTGYRSLATSTKKDTQQKILDTLKLDYEAFRNASFLEQNQVSVFAEKTSGERKEVLRSILQLQNYEQYEKVAKGKYLEIESKINELLEYAEENKNAFEKHIELVNLKSTKQREAEILQKKISNKQTTLNALEKNYLKFLKESEELKNTEQLIEDNLAEYEKIFDEIEKNNGDIAQLKQKIRGEISLIKDAGFSVDFDFEKELTERKKHNEEVVAKRTKYLAAKRSFENELLTLQNSHLNSYQKCPTCFRPITKEDHKHIDGYIKETSRKIQLKLSKISGLLPSLQEKPIDDLLSCKSLLGEINNTKGLYKDKKSSLESLQKKYKETDDKLVSLRDKETKLRSSLSVDVPTEADILELKETIKKLNNELQQYSFELGKIENEIKNNKKIVDTIKENKALIKSLKGKLSLLSVLVTAFGKKGIQALIFENCSVEIEKYANDILGRLTNNEVYISIDTLKKNLDGSFAEVFDINVSDGRSTLPFSNYSGGEKFRIAFALRVAISKLLAHRAGAKIEFLLCDEAFDSLDAEGRQKLVGVFNVLREDFKKLIVISHISEIKMMFDEVITVTKNENGSCIS